MKNITATIIALAMLLGMASCNDGTDVPAGTTAGSTTAETTASAETTEPEQTVATVTTEATEEVTTSDGVSEGTETAFPDFDINSKECLMYRLMGMTYEEIEAEFGEENIVSGNISDSGDAFYSLYLSDGTKLDITYYSSDECYKNENSWEIADEAKPGSITMQSSKLHVYPGINTSMSASEVSKIIPKWDASKIWGIGTVFTYAYINGYTFEVSWNMERDFCDNMKAELNGKDSDEMEVINQKYADEFIKNMARDSSKMRAISISHNKIT